MKNLKGKLFSSLNYVWKELKEWGKHFYDRLNLIKNLISIYEKVIRPLYRILATILQWAIPIIALKGKELLESIESIL